MAEAYDPKVKPWLVSKEGLGLMIMTILALIAGFYFFKMQAVAVHATDAVEGSSIFDFNVETSQGESVLLNTFKGKKAYLIVNVASK